MHVFHKQLRPDASTEYAISLEEEEDNANLIFE